MKVLKGRWQILQNGLIAKFAIDREISSDAVTATVHRISWTAPVMAAGNFLAALGFWMQDISDVAAEVLWRELIIRANFAVSFISLGIWILTRIVKEKASVKIQRTLVFTVVVFVLASGLVITLIDHLLVPGITPFLISVTIVGTFYYIPPKSSLLVFSLSYLAFRWAFSHFDAVLSASVLDSALINGVVASAVGFALATINWQHFRRTKMQEKTIADQQAALTQMAYHDSLTSLPNRRFLDELVKKEVALVKCGQVRSCLIMFDIDNFKEVNDTFGHPAGDNLLRQFAGFLQQEMRSGDTIVRLGGEEFVILAPNTSLDQAISLAEQLRKNISEHEFTADDSTILVTASFGVAELKETEGTRDYYQNADKALYEAKAAGKNCVAAASAAVVDSEVL